MMKVLKKSVLTIASVALTAGITAGATVSVHADDWPQPKPVYMYRLYNPNSGEHFYTSAQKEKDHLVSVGWKDEGFGWIGCSDDQGAPVYRLYNANAGEHHYTMSEKEKNSLVSHGWKDEGVGWYSYDKSTDTTGQPKDGEPVYREYNPNAYANNHNYTTDKDEHDHLVALGWKDEGIAWYAKFRNVLSDITGFNYNASTRTVSWNPVKHADRYILSIYKDANGDGRLGGQDENGKGDEEAEIRTIYEPTCTLDDSVTQPGTYFAVIDSWSGKGADDPAEHYLGSGYLYGQNYQTFEVK